MCRFIRPCIGILTLVAACLQISTGLAADHRDAPLLLNDSRTDINDLYAFQSPENSNRTVIIITVNPLAGVLNPRTFHPQAEYQILIDRDGDAKEDLTYRFRFTETNAIGKQRYTILQDKTVVARGVTGATARLRSAKGGRARTGVFDDPFFFDLDGFNNGLNFQGVDFFAGLNVSAIVLEVPSSTLGTENIGIWARTVEARGRRGRGSVNGYRRYDAGRLNPVDRMGRPAINTVLIPSHLKDAFNQGDPMDDVADFKAVVVATLTAAPFNRSTSDANTLANVLLPDILTLDTSNPAGFLNGRGLADDVIDAELSLLTNGGLTSDGVNSNDVPFPGSFPYLAPKH